MEKKIQIKRIVNIIGNILMIIAILFIVNSLLKCDFDIKVLFQKRTLIIFLIMIIAYSVSVISTSVPWRNVVYLLTESKIPIDDVATVSTKANVLKYIPGNIFQYIGRNQLALERGLKHSDVALSTIADVIINLSAVFFITVVFSFNTVLAWLKTHMQFSSLHIILIVLGGVISVLIFVVLLKKCDLLQKFKRFFTKRGIKVITSNFSIYFILSIYTTCIYMIVLFSVSEEVFQVEYILPVAGAVLFSWLVGFVTPGAPGGIGIRETVLIILIGGIFSESEIILGVVMNRVISILGDFLALLIMQIYHKVKAKRINE